MFPTGNKRLTPHPMHLNQILAPKRLPHIPKRPRCRLSLIFLLALQRIETHRFVCAQGVDVRCGGHEARVRDGRSVVNDLVEGVVFVGFAGVEDVD